MVTRRDYTAEEIEAARSVLIGLVHLLGEYKDDIVLIGGWVPEGLRTAAHLFFHEWTEYGFGKILDMVGFGMKF